MSKRAAGTDSARVGRCWDGMGGVAVEEAKEWVMRLEDEMRRTLPVYECVVRVGSAEEQLSSA